MSVLRSAMRTVSLKLPTSLDRQLDQLSQKRGTTRSALVREALEAYVSNPSKSVTAAAADLVGALDGPKDLSTAKRHFAGYGR